MLYLYVINCISMFADFSVFFSSCVNVCICVKIHKCVSVSSNLTACEYTYSNNGRRQKKVLKAAVCLPLWDQLGRACVSLWLLSSCTPLNKINHECKDIGKGQTLFLECDHLFYCADLNMSWNKSRESTWSTVKSDLLRSLFCARKQG